MNVLKTLSCPREYINFPIIVQYVYTVCTSTHTFPPEIMFWQGREPYVYISGIFVDILKEFRTLPHISGNATGTF